MRERAQRTLTLAGVAAAAVAGWNLQRGATRIGAVVAGAAVLALVTRVLVDADLRGPALRGARTHGPKVAIVGVLVVGSVAGYGPGALSVAQPASAEVTTETLDADQGHHVIIKTEGTQAAEINIWGITDGGDRHYLRRTTVHKDLEHYLDIGSAYDEVEVKVQTSSPTTTVDIKVGDAGFGANIIGDVGGDTNLQCGLAEQAASTFGTWYTDCNPVPDQSINTTKLDGEETHIQLYESALTRKQAEDNFFAAYGNYLEDTRSIAFIEAKNAYIRALNNQSTEATARARAKDAVDEYYSVKQRNLLAEWNGTLHHIQYIRDSVDQSASVSNIMTTKDADGQAPWDVLVDPVGNGDINAVTLLNGTTTNTVGPHYADWDGSSYSGYPDQLTYGTQTDAPSLFVIQGPNDNYQDKPIANLTKYRAAWTEIEAQSADVKGQVDTFVNNTYSEYQKGEINNSDLIDPYLASREYGPSSGNFSAWAATQLTLLGTNTPATLETTGNFTVYDNTTDAVYNGILLSDENPPGGTFEAGTTYDATTLGGAQYVVTDSKVHELTGQFTVQSITNDNGESVQSVPYRNISYSTSSTGEYADLLGNLTTTFAEIQAQQQEARIPSGGGGVGGRGLLGGIVAALGLPVNAATKGAVAVGGGVGIVALLSALSSG